LKSAFSCGRSAPRKVTKVVLVPNHAITPME
jgi:hypothetical protein